MSRTRQTGFSRQALSFGAAVLASLALLLGDAVTATTAAAQDVSLNVEALGGWNGPPEFDFNLERGKTSARAPSEAQRAALAAFVSRNPDAVVRFDGLSGSLDVAYGFASNPSGSGPEAAARTFIASVGDLFGGVDVGSLRLDALNSREAFGGYLLRFEQVHGGIPVINGGVGVVMDGERRVRSVSGPFFTGIDVNTSPGLTDGQALAAARGDLARFARNLPQQALDGLAPSFAAIEEQLGILTTPHPELAVYPTADGARLAWTFLLYSRNPFGLYQYTVDANSGELLGRHNLVLTAASEEVARLSRAVFQDTVPPATADVFPASPPITDALKERGALLDANGQEVGRPLGQKRVTLRKFDPSNLATGTEDVLTGTHALITSTLPTKLPFAQAARNTYHFDVDSLPIKGRTNEVDHMAEPAEHQDAVSQFFYITSFIEYLSYLHREGDAVHSRGVGQGMFPDEFPNDEEPLSGTVHIANVLDPPTDPSDPFFVDKLLGLDNAFAVPFHDEVAGQEVVVNPTAYGHGFLFNDLAIDFAVPLHEGTHATITPIAGLEGSPEGGALNEGQADVWAYTIGENPTLGGYIAAGFRLQAQLADPRTLQWLRHAESQLRYSQLCTRPGFGCEVHRDGEIYASAMWDLRQLLLLLQPSTGRFVRPNQETGEPTDGIALGKETFERLFLGSLYVLGTMSPDNFVRARDATIIADDVLYPTDPLDLDAPGRHRALIERVFANRELGRNAAAPEGGRQTISTAVSEFTAGQSGPAAPQNVVAEPIETDQIRVRWDAVPGAIAYQVLKRRKGSVEERLVLPGEELPGFTPARDYFDGDAAFSGFTHVEYVLGGNTEHVDEGQWFGTHAGLGLESVKFDYAVRAIGTSGSGQVAFSPLSGTAEAALAHTQVTDFVDEKIANVAFSGGVFAFDLKLENLGGAGSFDGTIFEPLTFKVLDISEPSVTAANADNGGSGQNGDEAHWLYGQSLKTGQTSSPRRLEFADPNAKLFTFDAIVTGFVRVAPTPATGSENPVDTADPAERPETFTFSEEFTGLVLVGTTGLELAEGVDYVDFQFTTKPSATAVTGTLSADVTVGPLPDLDFFLLDSEGNQLDSSETFGPNEQVGVSVVGGQQLTYRVTGWANGPATLRIQSDQEVADPADANSAESSSEPTQPLDGGKVFVTKLLRFTADPVTGAVSTQILQ